MRLNIRHLTLYSYSKTVFLEPHYLLMYPLQRAHVSVESIKFDIAPSPTGQALILDIFNNPMQQLWFEDMQNMLHIEVETVVDLKPLNPFNFLPHPSLSLADSELYTAEQLEVLSPFLNYETGTITSEMKNLLNDMVAGAQNDVIASITNILGYINQNWDHHVRVRPDVWSPQNCFLKKKGSCRDLAWMMTNMLRYLGLATRFVSGYSYNPELQIGHELHAWLEILIPGGGWVGVDPSLGLFVTDHFVPLAVGSTPTYTLPVRGTYRGMATSDLKSTVTIKKLSSI